MIKIPRQARWHGELFPDNGAYPGQHDLPAFAVHRFDRGHFTLKNKDDAIMPLIGTFPDRTLAGH